MKKILFFSAALIALLAITGCKKDNTPAKPTCRINQISTSNGTHTENYTLTYNANAKINTISFTGGSNISYAYNANKTVLTATLNDSTVITITNTRNSDGNPIIAHEIFSNSNEWESVSYDYSNGELSKATYTASYEPNSAEEYFSRCRLRF